MHSVSSQSVNGKEQNILEITLGLSIVFIVAFKQYREGEGEENANGRFRVGDDNSKILRCSQLNYSGLESERKTIANKIAHIPECMLELLINFQVAISEMI